MAKRRPQGDGTIRKRSDGRWEARIIIGHKNDGSPMYKSAFAKTQKSALKQLHQLLDLYRDVDLTEECRMTLGEWMDKWLDEYMIFTIKENTKTVSISTSSHPSARYRSVSSRRTTCNSFTQISRRTAGFNTPRPAVQGYPTDWYVPVTQDAVRHLKRRCQKT